MCSAITRRTPRSGSRLPSLGPVAARTSSSVDASLRAGAGERVEVDAELLRDLAHERRDSCFRCALGRRRGLRCRARPFPVGLAADDDEHGPDRDDLSFLDEDAGHDPRGGRRDLDSRLVGLDLDERVVLGDLLPLGDEPT